MPTKCNRCGGWLREDERPHTYTKCIKALAGQTRTLQAIVDFLAERLFVLEADRDERKQLEKEVLFS